LDEQLSQVQHTFADLQKVGEESGCKVNGSSGPPSLFSTVTVSAPGQEITGQDVVRSSEEKTAPAATPKAIN
jgi:hypothetical protein